MLVQRVEKHMIKPSNTYYALLDHFCFLSKNLYNHANYILRHAFINNHKAVPYGVMDKILKADGEYPDYRAMPAAQSAQQVLRLLEKNWKSFFRSIKDWAGHKEKYTGRPKLPKGIKINADINASCQILKKVFPAAYANGIEGVVLHPVRVNAAV